MDVLVGCCGLAGMKLEDYARRFPVLELQSTFYRLPRASTAERWKKVAPNLTFTLKAFQGITHPADSPTWRRSRKELEGVDPAEVGLLRVSGFTKRAWDETDQVAEIVGAKIVVVQLPPKYDCTSQNISKLRAFLSAVSTRRTPAIEFRHTSWFGRLREARAAIAPWDGILVTDPLKVTPPDQPLQYHRLHGSDGLVNYRHMYTGEELERIGCSVRGKKAYVLFNNLAMKEDAESLLRMLGEGPQTKRERLGLN
jgi:uncharacterized protein YecE (DUF72 family)